MFFFIIYYTTQCQQFDFKLRTDYRKFPKTLEAYLSIISKRDEKSKRIHASKD